LLNYKKLFCLQKYFKGLKLGTDRGLLLAWIVEQHASAFDTKFALIKVQQTFRCFLHYNAESWKSLPPSTVKKSESMQMRFNRCSYIEFLTQANESTVNSSGEGSRAVQAREKECLSEIGTDRLFRKTGEKKVF
jgi:hypothetical protein